MFILVSQISYSFSNYLVVYPTVHRFTIVVLFKTLKIRWNRKNCLFDLSSRATRRAAPVVPLRPFRERLRGSRRLSHCRVRSPVGSLSVQNPCRPVPSAIQCSGDGKL